jgi:hypothetical protein
LEFDQTDAGSVALRGASKTGYAEVYGRSSFSDQPSDKGVARFLSFNVQVGRSLIAAWIRMHEKEIFSGTPASENGPRDLDLRLAFGQHALRFGRREPTSAGRLCVPRILFPGPSVRRCPTTCDGIV